MSSDSLSFEQAIRLFKQWGFRVEPGPQPGEVTLIAEGPDYRTYAVYEAHLLPQIASVALRVRQQNALRRISSIGIAEHLSNLTSLNGGILI
jgi:hypothetical protein